MNASQAVWRKSSHSNGQANCVEVAFVPWRKSSRSNAQANCVEVAVGLREVAVRDSKNATGPVLAFPVAGWVAFVRR